jgi:hypothetical protein
MFFLKSSSSFMQRFGSRENSASVSGVFMKSLYPGVFAALSSARSRNPMVQLGNSRFSEAPRRRMRTPLCRGVALDDCGEFRHGFLLAFEDLHEVSALIQEHSGQAELGVFLTGLLQERLEFGLGEWLQSRARIYDMKHSTHLYWRVLSRAHGREGKNRRPRGKGIFIISTQQRLRPLRKAGGCLKNNALMRFRPLILGLRSMQVEAQCSSLLWPVNR